MTELTLWRWAASIAAATILVAYDYDLLGGRRRLYRHALGGDCKPCLNATQMRHAGKFTN
jgi:hypothetical protein